MIRITKSSHIWPHMLLIYNLNLFMSRTCAIFTKINSHVVFAYICHCRMSQKKTIWNFTLDQMRWEKGRKEPSQISSLEKSRSDIPGCDGGWTWLWFVWFAWFSSSSFCFFSISFKRIFRASYRAWRRAASRASAWNFYTQNSWLMRYL